MLVLGVLCVQFGVRSSYMDGIHCRKWWRCRLGVCILHCGWVRCQQRLLKGFRGFSCGVSESVFHHLPWKESSKVFLVKLRLLQSFSPVVLHSLCHSPSFSFLFWMLCTVLGEVLQARTEESQSLYDRFHVDMSSCWSHWFLP